MPPVTGTDSQAGLYRGILLLMLSANVSTGGASCTVCGSIARDNADFFTISSWL